VCHYPSKGKEEISKQKIIVSGIEFGRWNESKKGRFGK
jgi:hypothetical protein